MGQGYLNSEAALKALDPELRSQLTNGLNLNPSLIVTPQKPSIELSTDIEKAKQGTYLDDFQKQGQAQYEKQSNIVADSAGLRQEAWKTLQNRWDRLDPQTQIKNMNFNFLHRMKKSQLLIAFADHVQLKQPTSQDFLDIFADHSWETERNRVFEFKPQKDQLYKTGRAYLQHLRLVAEKTYNDSYVFNPMERPDGDLALHLNISRTTGERIGPHLANAISSLLLAHTYEFYPEFVPRLLNYKNNNVSFRSLENEIYSEEYNFGIPVDDVEKGLVGYHKEEERLEVRYHYLPPEEELKLLMYYLNKSNEEALEEIYQELKVRFTKERLAHLVQYAGLRGFNTYLDLLLKFGQEEVPPLSEMILVFEKSFSKTETRFGEPVNRSFDTLKWSLLHRWVLRNNFDEFEKYLPKIQSKATALIQSFYWFDKLRAFSPLKKRYKNIINSLELTVAEQTYFLFSVFSRQIVEGSIKNNKKNHKWFQFMIKVLKIDNMEITKYLISNHEKHVRGDSVAFEKLIRFLSGAPETGALLYNELYIKKGNHFLFEFDYMFITRSREEFKSYLDYYLKTGNESTKEMLLKMMPTDVENKGTNQNEKTARWHVSYRSLQNLIPGREGLSALEKKRFSELLGARGTNCLETLSEDGKGI